MFFHVHLRPLPTATRHNLLHPTFRCSPRDTISSALCTCDRSIVTGSSNGPVDFCAPS